MTDTAVRASEALTIGAREYEDRIRRLQSRLAETGLDAALVLSPPNVYYLSGFRHYVQIRPLGVLVPRSGAPCVITPKIEYEYAMKSSWIGDIRYYVEFPEPNRPTNAWELIASVVEEMQFGGRIGLELGWTSVNMLKTLQGHLPQVTFEDISPALAEMRLVKSPAEIELLRAAGQVAAKEWETAISVAAPGVPEYEVALAARDAGSRYAASLYSQTDDLYLSPIISGTQIMIASDRSSIPHGRASIRPLKKGDVVMMCFCMVNIFKGYRIGFTRHFSLGQPDAETQELYDRVLESQERCLEEVRPGVPASLVDDTARAKLAEYDLERYLTHRTGRGVGIDIAEGPEIKNTDHTILAPGMTFSIEPAVYIPGKIGFQIEDTVVVTQDGYEGLTPVTKDLVVL